MKIYVSCVAMIVGLVATELGATENNPSPLVVTDATRIKWSFLVEGGKCTPLQQIGQLWPGVAGAPNPEETFRLIKKRFPDAQLKQLIDVVAEDHKKHGTRPSAKEKDYYKPFTSNVFVLSFDNREEVLILANGLCERMYALLKNRRE